MGVRPGDRFVLRIDVQPVAAPSMTVAVLAGTVVTVKEPSCPCGEWFCVCVQLPNGSTRMLPWAIESFADKVDPLP